MTSTDDAAVSVSVVSWAGARPIEVSRRVAPKEELVLLTPLLKWLHSTRRIRQQSLLAFEVAWLGRRVDLVTLSASGRANSYELKLNNTGRALEQAIYNRAVFDRSYVVMASRPRAASLAVAEEHGVGVLVVKGDSVDHVLASPLKRADPRWRRRLIETIRRASE